MKDVSVLIIGDLKSHAPNEFGNETAALKNLFHCCGRRRKLMAKYTIPPMIPLMMLS